MSLEKNLNKNPSTWKEDILFLRAHLSVLDELWGSRQNISSVSFAFSCQNWKLSLIWVGYIFCDRLIDMPTYK